MDGDRGATLVATVVEHRDVLSSLESDGPRSSRELEAALEYSRATVNRRLADLRSEGLVEARDGRYELTEFGTVVLNETDAAFRRLGVVDALASSALLERLGELPLEFDLAWLEEATVVTASLEDPYRMHDRYLEHWDSTERVTGARSISVVPPNVVEQLKPKLRGETEVDSIWTPRAVTEYFDRYPELKSMWLDAPNAQLRITREPIPVQFANFDHRLAFIVHDDETGHPCTLVDTDNPEALEWGHDLYAYYRDRSQPLSAWLGTTVNAV